MSLVRHPIIELLSRQGAPWRSETDSRSPCEPNGKKARQIPRGTNSGAASSPAHFAASRSPTAPRTNDEVVRSLAPGCRAHQAAAALRTRSDVHAGSNPKLEEQLAWHFIERHGRPRLSSPVRAELFFGGVQANQYIDNLAKSCLDALNGIAFEDDRQVVELVAGKASDRTPQTVNTITEVRP